MFLNGAAVLLPISDRSRWIKAGDAEVLGVSGAENRSCGPKELQRQCSSLFDEEHVVAFAL